jgi:GT2 family glycosyltransferase
MIIGISFSSRNRPDLLEVCLTQLWRFLSPEKYQYVISVVIDQGDPVWDNQYFELMKKFPEVIWHKSEERLGIARAKNEGIKILKNHHADHFFLIDDDVFPVKKGFDELYIEVAKNNGVNHMLHQFPITDRIEVLETENGICKYMGSSGALLYFTRHAIDTIGGMRKDFKIYANEHTEISLRCHLAKLQGKWGAFMSPENSRDYIYAIDFDLFIFGVQPKDFIIDKTKWRWSVEGEDIRQYYKHNMEILQKMHPFFEEI